MFERVSTHAEPSPGAAHGLAIAWLESLSSWLESLASAGPASSSAPVASIGSGEPASGGAGTVASGVVGCDSVSSAPTTVSTRPHAHRSKHAKTTTVAHCLSAITIMLILRPVRWAYSLRAGR